MMDGSYDIGTSSSNSNFERYATVVLMIHNGSATIAETLSAVLQQDVPGRMRVICLCNGCKDGSALICTSFAERMAARGINYRVIDLPQGGRAAALNSIKDQIKGHLICIDQDAVLSPNCVREITSALEHGFEFASPELRVRLPQSWTIRQYYSFWKEIPYVERSPATIGFYALSAEVWPKALPVPIIHSDDKYMRLVTRPDKRTVVKGTTYQVNAPKSLEEMVRARRRYMFGNIELQKCLADRSWQDVPRWHGIVLYALRPDHIVAASVFALIGLFACLPVYNKRKQFS